LPKVLLRDASPATPLIAAKIDAVEKAAAAEKTATKNAAAKNATEAQQVSLAVSCK
jgi:hypothetical protein